MSNHKPCPNCSNVAPVEISFTWWGGFVGPKLFHHVQCPECGTAYNGKTGRSNATAIVVYTIVGVLVGIALMFLFWNL